MRPETIVNTTHYFFTEACLEGYCNYGDRLVCRVPRQQGPIKGDLRFVVGEALCAIQQLKKKPISAKEPEDKEKARAYRLSLKKRAVMDLYLWGFKQAERMVPNNDHNYDQLTEFIEWWNLFTKRNKAENISWRYPEVMVTVTKRNQLIKIKTEFWDEEVQDWVDKNEVEWDL